MSKKEREIDGIDSISFSGFLPESFEFSTIGRSSDLLLSAGAETVSPSRQPKADSGYGYSIKRAYSIGKCSGFTPDSLLMLSQSVIIKATNSWANI